MYKVAMLSFASLRGYQQDAYVDGVDRKTLV
jgi:hypothetical protein